MKICESVKTTLMANYDKCLKQNTVVPQQLYQQGIRRCTHGKRPNNEIIV